jgi:selenocysteine-specific elongation factor
MKSFIIGTAGHIDHGKTELIKALTGIDTDRLQEEKLRGISIELGFAEFLLSEDIAVGVVDVPGHEHFVKNMLAGATGFDMVLLVVAADDGVMPQTTEHLAIVDLLGVEDGVVAVTKADLVDEEMLELVREDVIDALKGTTIEGAEVVLTSSRTGQGLEELKEAISRVAERVRLKDAEGPFRLPIDRVFTLKGIGTVITGTLWEGSVADEDEAVIQPSGKKLRVRNIQVHGKDVERALAGQRVALNLPGISKDEIARGDVIATPGHLHLTMMIDGHLHLLSSAPRRLRNRTRIRFHHGTSEVMARVILLGGKEELLPGESAFVQFRLEKPVEALYSDRYIIRSYSPITTIGGGRILDSHPKKHKQHDASILESLSVSEKGVPSELLLLVIEERRLPLSYQELLTWTEVKEESLKSVLSSLISEEKVVEIAGNGLSLYITPDILDTLLQRIKDLTEEMHSADALKPGVEKEALRQRMDTGLAVDVFEALLSSAVSRGSLEVEAGRVRIAGTGRTLTQDQSTKKDVLLKAVLEGNFSPPMFKELMEVCGLAKNELRDFIDILLEEKEIEQVNPEYFLARGKLEEAEGLIRSHLSRQGSLSVGDMKEMLGTSRKYSIPLLEYFDRKRVTRREGDYRVSC